MRRAIRIIAFGVISLALVWITRSFLIQRARGNFRSYLTQTPPEFPLGGTWVNAPEPLRLADLRGNVIWLEFSFIE